MNVKETTVVQSYSLRRNMKTGQATTVVTFICPHCNTLHRQREIYSSIPANFSVVGYQLACGFVRVIMPWATKERQRFYGCEGYETRKSQIEELRKKADKAETDYYARQRGVTVSR
jgi:hypothetical protein